MGDQLTDIFNIQIVNHSVICFHVSAKFFHPSHGRAKRIPILVMHSITDYPKMTKEFVSEIQGKTMEARKGIEPPCKDLQSSTSPLCHRALVDFVLHTAFMGRKQALLQVFCANIKMAPQKTTGPFPFSISISLQHRTSVRETTPDFGSQSSQGKNKSHPDERRKQSVLNNGRPRFIRCKRRQFRF